MYKAIRWLILSICLSFSYSNGTVSAKNLYPWLKHRNPKRQKLHQRFKPPRGFHRIPKQKGSFAWWLRRLPLKKRGAPVRYHNGRLKANQRIHSAVIDLDIGRGNLQQCADAIMRLWGEYIWYKKLQRYFGFNLTSGHPNPWWRWARGDRLKIIRGRMRGWNVGVRRANASYRSFRRYLRIVMIYSGTASLSRELLHIGPSQIQAGDILLKGGYPGHAVLILDEVSNAKGKQLYLLGQSYMPAQSFHVLYAPGKKKNSWFSFPRKGQIKTPEWTFSTEHFYKLPHRRGTR